MTFKISTLNVLVLFFCILNFEFSCGNFEEKSTNENKFPEITYYEEMFLGVDNTFNTAESSNTPIYEGLNKPCAVQNNPITNEILVLDKNNMCIYAFNDKGEFIRKLGDKGQGPGELLMPNYIDIDNEGNIYIYEDRNKRISIFSKDGMFLKSFRVQGNRNTRFFITKERELVLNLPKRNYYFTIFSKEGEILREIGELTKYNKVQRINEIIAEGFPFVDSNRNYYIFLPYILLVKIFDENGILLNEKHIDEIFQMKYIKEFSIPPEKLNTKKLEFPVFIQSIIFKDNRFYIMEYDRKDKNRLLQSEIPIFVLNTDFKIVKKIKLLLSDEIEYSSSDLSKFEVLNKNDNEYILFPKPLNAEISKFYSKSIFK